jgi:spore maturation protein SpmA
LLNYVWLSLILLGVGTALFIDLSDITTDKYHNGEKIEIAIDFGADFDPNSSAIYKSAKILVPAKVFNSVYKTNFIEGIRLPASISFDAQDNTSLITIKSNEDSPLIWKEIAASSGEKNEILAAVYDINLTDPHHANAEMVIDDVSFVMMKNVTNDVIDKAGTAVTISLGLIGIMALWLGVMKVAEDAGLIAKLANMIKPITKKLFPEIPSDHPAIGAMIMNISANMLGLGNAATPFGLKAMEELDRLNPEKGIATNAMVTFLAINTAGLTLIPATAIAVRAASGSADPAIIIGPSIFGASCATLTGIIGAKLFEKFPVRKGEFGNWINNNWKLLAVILGLILIFLIATVSGLLNALGSIFSFIDPGVLKDIIQIASTVAIPILIFSFIGYGAIKKVKVYEQFVEGAKEGFNIAIRIIPYLVAMLVAIGIFREGGALKYLLDPIMRLVTNPLGMPPEALPMALIRPLSGSGSLGVMAEIMSVHGPDSFIGILVSTFFGSTETTFYVLAVYFGAVSIRKTRHAVPVGLLADVAGILGALFIVKLMFS